jgi:hypothetical protein
MNALQISKQTCQIQLWSSCFFSFPLALFFYPRKNFIPVAHAIGYIWCFVFVPLLQLKFHFVFMDRVYNREKYNWSASINIWWIL